MTRRKTTALILSLLGDALIIIAASALTFTNIPILVLVLLFAACLLSTVAFVLAAKSDK